MSFILIKSTDNTDVLVNTEKIAFVAADKKGCFINFGGEAYIRSGASFDDVVKAIEKGANNEKV